MLWNHKRTELCLRLWSEGFSASQIANRIGGISRNAVIGKMHRLGLSHRVRPRLTKKRVYAKPSKAPEITLGKRQRVREDGEPFAPRFSSMPLPPEPARPEKTITLLDLEPHHCRFPFGDGKTEPIGFCGCQKAAGSSYCLYHSVLCTNAPAARRLNPTPERNLHAMTNFIDEKLEAIS